MQFSSYLVKAIENNGFHFKSSATVSIKSSSVASLSFTSGMAENIDISTHQLGELAYNALNGKVSLESILTIWHNIGWFDLLIILLSPFLFLSRRSCETIFGPEERS